MRQTINSEKTSYDPNTISNGCPFQAKFAEGGFTSFEERIDSKKIRERSKSFFDHFSQATLFYDSQSEYEKRHMQNALIFELGKLERPQIRERFVGLLTQVSRDLAAKVADGLGIPVPPKPEFPMNHSFPADANPKDFQPVKNKRAIDVSPALSMANTIKNTIKSRQIAILIADGFDAASFNSMVKALEAEGAQIKTIAPKLGEVKAQGGKSIKADQGFLHTSSVLFDAVFVPGGQKSGKTLSLNVDAINFVDEMFLHCKPIAALGEGRQLLAASRFIDLDGGEMPAGIVIDKTPVKFIEAIAMHRFWEREK